MTSTSINKQTNFVDVIKSKLKKRKKRKKKRNGLNENNNKISEILFPKNKKHTHIFLWRNFITFGITTDRPTDRPLQCFKMPKWIAINALLQRFKSYWRRERQRHWKFIGYKFCKRFSLFSLRCNFDVTWIEIELSTDSQHKFIKWFAKFSIEICD